ncbi:MAG: aspartate-semialdehyde dehydrogenase [Acidobacteria bacterium]|nr:aspartate-semialdehyde dehydrogenase [Acidobacteriota bacterium]MCA1609642.1 aspartate-semialdehyde dehydrogenase [Acidobacteriota bacterium]
MTSRIPVGLLGATGTVGQRFVERLADHPWFEIACVAASDRSRGRSYGEAAHWRLPTAIPDRLAGMRVCGALDDLPCRLVFSALDAALAREVEPELARRGILVFSNASAHRMDEDVPLLLPEINPESLRLLDRQRRDRSWTGGIVTNANCSTIVLALALAPLHRAFGIRRVFVATMQAVSGAGYPGVPSLDILGNVIPDIPEEAEKIERETRRILGDLSDERVTPARFEISAMTCRVAVEDGHTESVSVELRKKAELSEVHAAWEEFRAPEGVRGLPSAPERPVVPLTLPHRPQPRRDVDLGGGMSVTVGSLKPCPVFDWKFTALGHNTIRGAAGASVLNAEYACATGLLD